MSGFLLVLTIGPVQDFIASARRTRDLWFGSYLLSEVSKAAAKMIEQDQGWDSLIFPSPERRESLEKGSELNVANVILAKVRDPERVFESARQAARVRWREFAGEAKDKIRECGLHVSADLWESQVEDAIECYGAWTPLEGDYRQARKRVMRLLAARKQCRDFKPNAGRQGVPKSSLDGLRESVIEGKREIRAQARLRIKAGEQLCAIGLTKRIAGGEQAFPSVSRVAAEPWVRAVSSDPRFRESWDSVKGICGELEKLKLVAHVRGNGSYGQNFPYEGTVLFRSRLKDILEEKEGCPDPALAEQLISRLHGLLKGLQSPKAMGEPTPYLAILAADGDKMGRTISDIGSAEDHRHFSTDLSGFAGAARRIVQESSGVCVYSGGDDVLAFLPVDSSLSCARALRQDFIARMGKWKDGSGKSPTLSVGVAIGHAMEDLGDLLKFAREAESLAKNGNSPSDDPRDALAVVVRARGNEACALRERWQADDGMKPLDVRLGLWAELHAAGCLPSKFAYELRQTAEFYRTPAGPVAKNLADALKVETLRIFRRKDVRLQPDEELLITALIERIGGAEGLLSLASELIIGQWLSEGLKTGKGGELPCR